MGGLSVTTRNQKCLELQSEFRQTYIKQAFGSGGQRATFKYQPEKPLMAGAQPQRKWF